MYAVKQIWDKIWANNKMVYDLCLRLLRNVSIFTLCDVDFEHLFSFSEFWVLKLISIFILLLVKFFIYK